MKFTAWFAIPVMMLALLSPARAELFDIGSTFTVSGDNAPNNYLQGVTLTPGTTTIDNGAVQITQTFVNAPGGAEWLVLDMLATNGFLYGDPNAIWGVAESNILFNTQVSLVQGYVGFGVACAGGGSCGLVSPIATCSGCTIETNPALGISQVVGIPFAGTGNEAQFSFGGGVFSSGLGYIANPNVLDEIQLGLEVIPAPTPLPPAVTTFGVGLALLFFMTYWRTRRIHLAPA
jgi:hypothetical protein